MIIKLVSEDCPDGEIVDWPVVPGTGDFIDFHYRGGTVPTKVSAVLYEVDAPHSITGVTVTLDQ